MGRYCAVYGERAEWVGAGDGIRTHDINLGKVALYQLSYSRARRIATIVSLPDAIVNCGNRTREGGKQQRNGL